jgi:hypothetical protein
MSTLERAIKIAAEAHAGQVDKAGQRYISHPLRVMAALTTTDEMIVGVLHDVVEDCPRWTFDRLRAEGFSELVLGALDSVSKRKGEDYEAFIRRAGANAIGSRVKRADLEDNMDLTRIASPTDRDHARIERYRAAAVQLEASERKAVAHKEWSKKGLLMLFLRKYWSRRSTGTRAGTRTARCVDRQRPAASRGLVLLPLGDGFASDLGRLRRRVVFVIFQDGERVAGHPSRFQHGVIGLACLRAHG